MTSKSLICIAILLAHTANAGALEVCGKALSGIASLFVTQVDDQRPERKTRFQKLKGILGTPYRLLIDKPLSLTGKQSRAWVRGTAHSAILISLLMNGLHLGTVKAAEIKLDHIGETYAEQMPEILETDPFLEEIIQSARTQEESAQHTGLFDTAARLYYQDRANKKSVEDAAAKLEPYIPLFHILPRGTSTESLRPEQVSGITHAMARYLDRIQAIALMENIENGRIVLAEGSKNEGVARKIETEDNALFLALAHYHELNRLTLQHARECLYMEARALLEEDVMIVRGEDAAGFIDQRRDRIANLLKPFIEPPTRTSE